jgi:hypothetical protein
VNDVSTRRRLHGILTYTEHLAAPFAASTSATIAGSVFTTAELHLHLWLGLLDSTLASAIAILPKDWTYGLLGDPIVCSSRHWLSWGGLGDNLSGKSHFVSYVFKI